MLNLKQKCATADLEAIFKRKGYVWFKNGSYNLNIIGVRSNQKNVVTNSYDDYLIVDYRLDKGTHKRVIYSITTEPGKYYLLHPCAKNGAAILVPNQYRGCWQLGLHKGEYKALCQKKPVTVYRDNNKDEKYDMNPDVTETGVFGINIHRSNKSVTSKQIDKWSAGCQVFNSPTEFNAFMRLCEEQAKRYGNSFTYTLIEEKDLDL